jgi:hypothetical protein
MKKPSFTKKRKETSLGFRREFLSLVLGGGGGVKEGCNNFRVKVGVSLTAKFRTLIARSVKNPSRPCAYYM